MCAKLHNLQRTSPTLFPLSFTNLGNITIPLPWGHIDRYKVMQVHTPCSFCHLGNPLWAQVHAGGTKEPFPGIPGCTQCYSISKSSRNCEHQFHTHTVPAKPSRRPGDADIRGEWQMPSRSKRPHMKGDTDLFNTSSHRRGQNQDPGMNSRRRRPGSTRRTLSCLHAHR